MGCGIPTRSRAILAAVANRPLTEALIRCAIRSRAMHVTDSA